MEKISVIIPTYNSARYLKEALDSVVAQTYPAYEIIVVDDGSTDGTAEVVKEYTGSPVIPRLHSGLPSVASHQSPVNSPKPIAQSPQPIKYLYQVNRGPAAARNTGIRAATGEYIAFLDSDDIWLPKKIELQLIIMSHDAQVGITGCNSYAMDQDGKITALLKYENYVEKKKFINKLIHSNIVSGGSNALIRKECFDNVGLFDEDIRFKGVEDWDMWLRICQYYEIRFAKEPLVMERAREGSVSSLDNIGRMLKNELSMIDKQFVENIVFPKKLFLKRRLYSYRHLRAACTYIQNNNKIRSREYALKALYLYPFAITSKSFLRYFLWIIKKHIFKKKNEMNKMNNFSKNGLKIEIVSDIKDFAALRAEWNTLLSLSYANTIYLTWEWLYTWWEVYGDALRKLHILVVKDDKGKIKAIAPFIIRKKYIANLFTSKVLEFLGTGEKEIEEVCSNYMDIIVNENAEDICEEILKYLLYGFRKGYWNEINLTNVSISSRLLELLKNNDNRVFFNKYSEPASCAIIKLPKQWDEYLYSISKSWRDQIRRGRKEISTMGTAETVLITDPKQINIAFDEFIALHQKRWQEIDKPGLFSNNKFTEFHRKILKLFSNNQWVGIRLLRCNGKIVAASYRFNYGKTIYFYSPAYDRNFKTKIGIGLIERSYDIEDGIRNEYLCYDFYKAKIGSYKWHLAKDRRGVQDILVLRKDFRYFLYTEIEHLKRLKREMRKLCLGNQKP